MFDPMPKDEVPAQNPARSEASNPLGPFLLGTVLGGLAGAVAGTLLSHHTRHLLVGMIHLIGRRLSGAESDDPRFELLLQ